MTTKSLGEFERLYGPNKGTVKKAANEAGFDTSSGLTPDAWLAMEKHFQVGQFSPRKSKSSNELVHVDSFDAGLEFPTLKETTVHNLEIIEESFEDPLSIALKYQEAGEQLIQGLEKRNQALEKRAEDTRLAAQMIREQKSRVALAQRQSEIQTAVKSEFLKRDLVELQSLTKDQDIQS